MYVPAPNRSLSALASGVLIAGGLLALLHGLADVTAAPAPRPVLTTVEPPASSPSPTPTPTPPLEPDTREATKGAPAPAGLRGKASQVVAPKPPLVLLPPPPMPAATVSGSGSGAAEGAADRSGPGSGAGGEGRGAGGGGNGGNGAGRVNAGVALLPRQIAGRLRFSDLPEDLREVRQGSDITLRYRIGTDGRVSGCTILVSSGRPDFDRATCDTLTRRFRFRPARDGDGNAVAFIMTEIHGWDDAAEGM